MNSQDEKKNDQQLIIYKPHLLLFYNQIQMNQNGIINIYPRIILIIILLIIDVLCGLNSVTVSPLSINSIATYTWSISLTSTPISSLSLTFASQVTILANSTLTINTASQSFTKSGNTITIATSISSSALSIVITNIQNPSSAISTNSFSYTTNLNTTPTILSSFNSVQYLSGTLSSCSWSFSLCTQQFPSDLFISITTINKIPMGNNYFLVGFPVLWANHYAKGMMTGITNPSCSYSFNGLNYTNATSCIISGSQITIGYSNTAVISSGTSITVKVGGVNSPPTKQTASSISYYIYTTDSTQVKIDGLTGCIINNICVTNSTKSTLNNPITSVNSNYPNPSITFEQVNPITIQPSDTIEISYTPFTSLLSCNGLTFYRLTEIYNIGNPIANNNSIVFTFPNTNGPNIQSSTTFNLLFSCSDFILPPSESPVTLAIIWKRSSSNYLELNASIIANAALFNSSKGVLSLSSTSMLSSATFSFNFVLSQPLGNNPSFILTIPSDFIISSTPICTISILGMNLTSSSCSFTNSTRKIIINLVINSTIISVNSNVTINIQNVTNPARPKAYYFGLETYYDQLVNTSRVEASTTAFTTTTTEIYNYPITLTPTGLTVYTKTNILLTFTSTISIPQYSTFTITFPSGVSGISSTGVLLQIGNATANMSGSANVNGLTVIFVSVQGINTGNIIVITIPITTPSSIGIYSYIQLVISNDSTNYLSSKSSMSLNVNAVSSMNVSVVSLNSITGSKSAYNITLFLTIPHGSTFIVEISIPLDTQFVTSNALCTNCTSNITSINSTNINFIANNSVNSSQLTFTISSFINPRSVGSSSLWGITTKTVNTSNLISYSTATATISYPNILTANLSKSQSYYRNNTSPLKITLTSTNKLITADYIQLTFTSDTYSMSNGSSISCSPIYGTCSLVGNASAVTVVKINPNFTGLTNNSFYFILQGLTSTDNSPYQSTYNIGVKTYTTSGNLIDSGNMIYNVSCNENSSNLCRRCYSNGSCIDCYLNLGYYIHANSCVTSCGSASSYLFYENNITGICVACINNCLTCSNSTTCRTCISGYYLFLTDKTCKQTCPTAAGYYASNSTYLVCGICISNCLQCINGSNSCIRCNNQTLLLEGSCQSSCGSTRYYVSNGVCITCDISCYNCSGPGSNNCYNCSTSYHRYTNLCVNTCPNGTAVNPATGDCGCESRCQTCSNYTTCTSCANSSLWAFNGNCISSCPNATYNISRQCISCSTGCIACTITTCTACLNGSYLFNNTCYSDCNLISLQYDNLGSTCTLCPTGCDRCNGINCTVCLASYSLIGSACILTCTLNNSCNINDSVLPLPGLIGLSIWVSFCVVIYFFCHQHSLSYSIFMFSGLIQIVLLWRLFVSALVSADGRVLSQSNPLMMNVKWILLAALSFNYLQNIVYLIFFAKRVCCMQAKQLKKNYYIFNIILLIIAVFTNFRIGLIAFSGIFTLTKINIENEEKLKIFHILCAISSFLDIVFMLACGLIIVNSTPYSLASMLSIDLLIIGVVNIILIIVIWAKPCQESKVHIIQQHTNHPTEEKLANEPSGFKAINDTYITENMQKMQKINQILEEPPIKRNRLPKLQKIKTFESIKQRKSLKEVKLPGQSIQKMNKQDPNQFKNRYDFNLDEDPTTQNIRQTALKTQKTLIQFFKDSRSQANYRDVQSPKEARNKTIQY